MQTDVEPGLGGGEVVGEAGELVRDIRHDERPAAAEWRLGPREPRETVGDLAREPVVQAFGRSLGAGQVQTANGADHASRRHAAEEAVALEEERTRAGSGRRDGRGDPRAATARDHHVVAPALHASFGSMKPVRDAGNAAAPRL